MKQHNSHKQTGIFLMCTVNLTALVLAAGLLAGCPTGVNSNGGGGAIFKTDGNGIITGYTGELPKKLVIPAKIGNEVITGIGDKTFEKCEGLTEVGFPESLTSIGDWTFADCENLTALHLPKELTSIGAYAFSVCEGLTAVVIPAKVTSIDGGAFADCTNLASLTVDKDNTMYTGKDNLIYTKDMQTLVAAAVGSNVTSLNIPESVISIEDSACSGFQNLTQVSFPDSLTSIGHLAFSDCENLETVVLPTKLQTIGMYAFDDCKKTEITLPESIKTIGEAAFGKKYDNSDTYCKKVLIKKGSHFEKIKALVTGDPCKYPANRVGEYQ